MSSTYRKEGFLAGAFIGLIYAQVFRKTQTTSNLVIQFAFFSVMGRLIGSTFDREFEDMTDLEYEGVLGFGTNRLRPYLGLPDEMPWDSYFQGI